MPTSVTHGVFVKPPKQRLEILTQKYSEVSVPISSAETFPFQEGSNEEENDFSTNSSAGTFPFLEGSNEEERWLLHKILQMSKNDPLEGLKIRIYISI